MNEEQPKEERTSIAMSRSVKERIDAFGRKNESYDSLLTRIMDDHDKAEYERTKAKLGLKEAKEQQKQSEGDEGE